LAKIAAIVLSFDEGVSFVEQMLTKQAGAEAAEEVLGFIAAQNAEAEKQAAFAEGSAAADYLIDSALMQAGAAQAKAAAAKQGDDTYTKLGQAVADASIADLMGGMGGGAPGGAAPAGGMPPDAAGGMPPEAAGADAGGGGQDEYTPDEVMQALQQLVQEGTIQPEEAQQVMEMLQSGGDQGGAPQMGASDGAAAGGAESAPEAPAEAAPGAEASGKPEGNGPEEKGEPKAEQKKEDKSGKEASAPTIQSILASIKTAQAKK
jgi:hypothetical protein